MQADDSATRCAAASGGVAEAGDQHRAEKKLVKDFVLQIAVRIDDADAAAGVDVLDDDVLERGRFPNAGLADDEHVVHAIEFGQCELFFAGVTEDGTDEGEIRIEVKVHSRGRLQLALPKAGK